MAGNSEGPRGFAGLEGGDLADLAGVAVALLGIDEASPYEPGRPSHSAGAAAAIRKASAGLPARRQFDFDIDRVLLGPGRERLIVDLGDLDTDPGRPEENRARIEAAIRKILLSGAVPVVIGGDDSVPIPVLRAYEGSGPLTVLQIDAHVDWGDVIEGNPLGYGSIMRRAAEMDWVRAEVQVGIRGLGSGTPDQIEDARAWGSRIVTMAEFRRLGAEAVASLVPEGAPCFVTIDLDGLDPSIMPAVNMPGPGGLLYGETLALLQAAARRAPIAGICMVEFVPARDDPHGLAALTAARLLLSAIGLVPLPGGSA
ncbi:arginase family protein [Enterovirga aerilata]|uniref:Arginase n=1 Tax=Enterovirga aerilata TaxID=2730920 RepID=A0A849HXG3_9HYPH|nr:arginase family protein [Enterovirga sp. DB1703]NNM72236.1 arginase [Enterovirga sp. DB1703]